MKTMQELHEWVLGQLKQARAMEQVKDAAGSNTRFYSGQKDAFEEVASHMVIFCGCEAAKDKEEEER